MNAELPTAADGSAATDAGSTAEPAPSDAAKDAVVRLAASSGIDIVAYSRPHDLAGVRDAVLEAAAADRNILVHGGSTKLSWGASPHRDRTWAVIDTRSLDALVHHEPGDMTAVVQAGLPLSRLRAELASAGQQFAVDPPRRGGGPTVGGVYTSNDAGPHRFRYGGVRDVVIGPTTVLSDGTVSRSGGAVIKNVAGYDLNKLWCGSLGTLGLVVQMTVRLHPLPETGCQLRIPASAEAASSFLADLISGPDECSVLEWTSVGGGMLAVGLEGREGGLSRRVDAVVAVAHRHGLVAEHADFFGAEAADDAWAAWREAHGGEPGETIARAATLPGHLAAAAAALDEVTRDIDVEAHLRSHAGLGLHDAVISGDNPSSHAAVVRAWRDRIVALGGSVVLRDRADGVDRQIDPWGEAGSSRLMDLTRSVKRALDPDSRFAPGRFVGGI